MRGTSRLLDGIRQAGPQDSGPLHSAAAAAFVMLNGDGHIDTVHRMLAGAIAGGAHGYDAGDTALLHALWALAMTCFLGGRRELWDAFHAAVARLTPGPPPILALTIDMFADPARTGVAALPRLEAALRTVHHEVDPNVIDDVAAAAMYADRLAEVREPLEGRTGEPASVDGTRIWAGRIADSFYIDLSLLAIVNEAVAKGTAPDLSAWRPDQARNSFSGNTAEAIVLEISHAHPRLRPGARTGVWCATRLATDAGGWRQVNRAGHPMMWPIFWPGDTDFSDPANTRHPSEDLDAAGQYLGDQVAAVVAANGASADPHGYGQTVTRELFPDVLPYVIGTPASYGFAGFNGRTLADNAPEAMLSLVTGTAVPSGLTPAVAGQQRDSRFPYVVPA